MKRTVLAFLPLLCAAAAQAEHLIPAGSLIQCTLAEPKLSSKTVAIGDPVLCQVSHTELHGRSTLPYGAYLVGRFEDYKDPGHIVGRGWMELRFDRMVIEPDTVIPVEAKVVYVHGYNVDRDGRILGKGHPVEEAVTWSIPILWPLDILMIPRRGPRPVLKEETRLTLKVMDDLGIPDGYGSDLQRDSSGLAHRPVSYDTAPAAPIVQQTFVQPAAAPVATQYLPPPPPPAFGFTYVVPPPPPPLIPRRTVMVFRNGYTYPVYLP
jgi:hypothetical protein